MNKMNEEFGFSSSLFFLFLSCRGEVHDDEEPSSSFSTYFSSCMVPEPWRQTLIWDRWFPSFFFPNLLSFSSSLLLPAKIPTPQLIFFSLACYFLKMVFGTKNLSGCFICFLVLVRKLVLFCFVVFATLVNANLKKSKDCWKR